MSRTLSTSSNKPYGVARATAVWGLARSSYYARRKCAQEPRIRQKRGPKRLADEELADEIRQVLEESVFHGEGYRKVWARLRHKNVRAWRDRVLRVMREHQLLSPNYVADVGAHGSPNQPEVLCATVHCCKSTGEGLRSSTELPCAYAP